MASTGQHGDRILGLRQQILANAAIVFSEAISYDPHRHTHQYPKPEDTFDIVTIGRSGKFRALVVYGSPARRQIALAVQSGDSHEGALQKMLDILSEMLDAWYNWCELEGRDDSGLYFDSELSVRSMSRRPG